MCFWPISIMHVIQPTSTSFFSSKAFHQKKNATSLNYPMVKTTIGASVHLATSSCHISLSSALLRWSLNTFSVYSVMLSSHLFLHLPLFFLPCTVPCKIVLSSPVYLVTCTYHFNFSLFVVVRRSSWDPTAFMTVLDLCICDMVFVWDARVGNL